MSTRATELTSIGKASRRFARLPDDLRQAASEIGVTPKFKIDTVEYYSPDQLDRIGERLREPQAASERG